MQQSANSLRGHRQGGAVNRRQAFKICYRTRLGGHNGTGWNGAIQRIYTLESN
nr:MAG TPA_asm: hypothetical protein [Caudoviricetes sp.]